MKRNLFVAVRLAIAIGAASVVAYSVAGTMTPLGKIATVLSGVSVN